MQQRPRVKRVGAGYTMYLTETQYEVVVNGLNLFMWQELLEHTGHLPLSKVSEACDLLRCVGLGCNKKEIMEEHKKAKIALDSSPGFGTMETE